MSKKIKNKKTIYSIKKDVHYYYKLANDYSNKKMYKDAIKMYKSAIKLRPEEAIFFNNLGNIYSECKKYNEAICEFKKAIKLNDNNFTLYCNLGFAYYKQKKYIDAIREFNKSIELEPLNSIVYNDLGLVYLALNEYNKAIKVLNKAVELDSSNSDIFYNLSLSYFKSEKYDKAIYFFKETIKLNPRNGISYEALGNVYLIQKKYTEAINEFKKAIEINPIDGVNYNNLGVAYLEQEKYEEAIKLFKLTGHDFNLLKALTSFLKKSPQNSNKYEMIKKEIKEKLTSKNLSMKANKNYTYNYKFKNNFFKDSFWKDIELFIIIEILNIASDIEKIKIYQKIAKLIDKNKIKDILDLELSNNLSKIKEIIKNKDNEGIKIIRLKLFLLENLKNEVEEYVTDQNYQAIVNVSNIYIAITKGLQEEISELTAQMEREKAQAEIQKEKEKVELQQNIMQAVSHTLGNLLLDQKIITKFLKNNDELEKKVKKLKFFQEITSSLLNAIKIAFGGKIDNNIEFFNTSKNNRISLKSIMYFIININIDKLLKRTPIWKPIYNGFFDVNKQNKEEIREKKKECQNDESFNILELSDTKIDDFIDLFRSEKFNIINRKFNLKVDDLKNIYIENDSYAFAIIFIILQELIFNIFKYGIINENKVISIVSSIEDDFYTLSLSNYFINRNEKKSGTLKGLEMIEMFANILGEFEKNIEDDKFLINIKIKKELFTGDNRENIMG